MSWDDKNGMVLNFDFEYDEETLMHERLTEIIEAFKNDELVKEELSETTMTDVGEMEIENLIHLNFASKDIYETILKTKHTEKIKEALVRNLEKVRDSFEVEWNTSVYRIAEKLRNERENKLKFIK